MIAVCFCEPLVPKPGCRVVFEVSSRKPKYETDLPFAANAEIYNPPDVMAAAGLNALAGKADAQ